VYEVVIEAEACVLHCEVTNVVDEPAHVTTWASDREGLGYRELEFRAPSGKWFDPEGNSHNLGRNGCAEIADRYAEYIEEQLWRQIDLISVPLILLGIRWRAVHPSILAESVKRRSLQPRDRKLVSDQLNNPGSRAEDQAFALAQR